jgi:hypothetical protein
MFHHNSAVPCAFFFTKGGDEEFMDRLRVWFLTRRPEHIIRCLVNHEAKTHNASHELVFANPIDAMEFKLTFL